MTTPSSVRPKLSIIIAAFNNTSLLTQCLTSLQGQWKNPDIEICVVSNYQEKTQEVIKKQFPHVKYFLLPAKTTVPMLRAYGITHTTGDIAALTEDHCTFDENWCTEIKKAHELPYPVIGGSVENASGNRLLDWAVYFYDYGRYMLPNQEGAADALSGNNVSYKRTLLHTMEKDFQKGFFETVMHWKIKNQGQPLYLASKAIVCHRKNYTFNESMRDCYHHARSFGGMRTSGISLLQRILFVIGSLTLPILLPLRIASRVFGKKRHRGKLLLSMPLLILLMTSWSFGELCGYLFKEGKSIEKWT